MRILVTGATGFIGNVLVKELADFGYDVVSLCLEGEDVSHVEKYSRVIYGNVLDKSSLTEPLLNVDIVCHLAGIIDLGFENHELVRKVNVEGTKNVINAAYEHNIKKFLYVSSVHAIPEDKSFKSQKEPITFDPDLVEGDYPKTKAEASKYVQEFSESHQMNTIIILPSGVIGPYDYKNSNTGYVIRRYIEGKMPFYLDGAYNFIDVRDVATGIRLAIEKGEKSNSYILSGYQLSVKQILDELSSQTGFKKVRKKISYKFLLFLSKVMAPFYKLFKRKPLLSTYSLKVLKTNPDFSNRKAKKKLGFKTRTFQETIRDTIKFIIGNKKSY